MNLFNDQSPPPKRAKSISAETVGAIYMLYPKKIGRKVALAAIKRALRELIKEGDDDPVKTLMDATREFYDAVLTWPEIDRQYIPMPATWFNQGRWEDDRSEWYKGERKRPAPTGKILSMWEDKIKQDINAVTNAPSDREQWARGAALRTTLTKIPERLRDEPTIIASIKHAEALL